MLNGQKLQGVATALELHAVRQGVPLLAFRADPSYADSFSRRGSGPQATRCSKSSTASPMKASSRTK